MFSSNRVVTLKLVTSFEVWVSIQSETRRADLRYAFEQLHLNRVYAAHFRRNPASGRIMQKIGMTYEGRLRQHVKKWGDFEDMEYYGILRSEWSQSAASATTELS